MERHHRGDPARAAGEEEAAQAAKAMVPAATAFAKTEAGQSASKVRVVAMEMVHGAAGSTAIGVKKNLWAPAATGRDFDLSPTSLTPLEPFRNDLTIISNTDLRQAEAFTLPEIGGDHFRASSVFLTQSHPKQTMGSDLYVGTSFDQVYAKQFGQDTAIPSMQLSIEAVDHSGGCEYNYSCAYTDAISWASPSEPLPMLRDPRAVFDALFGVGATPEDRARRRREDTSVLDTIVSALDRLKRQVGAADRARLADYLDDVREIERRIQNVEASNRSFPFAAVCASGVAAGAMASRNGRPTVTPMPFRTARRDRWRFVMIILGLPNTV